MEKPYKKIEFQTPANIREENISDAQYCFVTQVVEMENDAIVAACVDAAQKEGIDSLHLIDKNFVIRALRRAIREEEYGSTSKEWISKKTVVSMLEARAEMSIGEAKSLFYHVARMIRHLPAFDAVEPKEAMDFIESYKFVDDKEVYTNGAELVPMLRVKQALQDKAYNGFLTGGGS